MAKILVIEDNPSNLKLTTLFLEKSGHGVLQAMDAETGIVMAREHNPDIILMDVQLPGVDGLVATTILKKDEKTKSIPIIALTAHAMKGDEKRMLEAGCDGYLAKPLRRELLVNEVNRWLQPPGNL